jgi:hypothetical protein
MLQCDRSKQCEIEPCVWVVENLLIEKAIGRLFDMRRRLLFDLIKELEMECRDKGFIYQRRPQALI